jgi:elongation factor P--(R)-beta-lysine ligase
MSTYKELKNNPRLLEIYKQRIEIIKLIREFFWLHKFKEVETPIAVKLPGQEPYLQPIPVLFHDPSNQEEKFYLQTSPEFAMKKLIASGFKNIFQICKCFRDHESWGGMHNTEFTMIEWYRSPGELADIMDDTESLFKYVAKNINFKNDNIDVYSKWDRKSMKELWQEYLNVDLDNYLNLDNIKKLVTKLEFNVDDKDSYEDLFFQIFLNKIEPFLGKDKPIFVYDYPACMCSLSKLCQHDDRYAQRTELYINGIELANAFGELTDSTEQQKRLEEDKSKRKELDKEIYDVDPEFIESLNQIKQKTAGIALGVDRMVLLLTQAKDLNEVIFQSVNDQI